DLYRSIVPVLFDNTEQTVPYELSANATQSVTKIRSSEGGTSADFNYILMEYSKGVVQFFIHAESNQDIEFVNDETHCFGHGRTKTIDHDHRDRGQQRD
ncbi:bacteriophage T4 gp5 trimerisation domain-containing protein, partial [Pseudomonas aeruginosa]